MQTTRRVPALSYLEPLAAVCALIAILAAPGVAIARARGPLEILGTSVAPGTRAQLTFLTEASFLKDALDVPVVVVRESQPGPTLCLTAGIHGDELNGVEIARASFDSVDEKALSGTLVAMPFIKVWGFRSSNRYLPDRRDLNRGFPGSRTGSTASRIAYTVFENVIRKCDALVDLHTGSNRRANLPQIRVDLDNEAARVLAIHFDVGIVLHGAGPKGSLRREAADAGIAAIIYEAGGPDQFEIAEIERGIEGVRNVMERLDMVGEDPPPADPQRVYREASWVRSPGSGIFLTDRSLGDRVRVGDALGIVTDPVTNQRFVVESTVAGRVIGMAHPQVVLPGYALFQVTGRAASAQVEDEPDEDTAR